MEVMLRTRSDSNPVQDDPKTSSLTMELLRPPAPPRSSTFTVDLLPDGQEEEPQAEISQGIWRTCIRPKETVMYNFLVFRLQTIRVLRFGCVVLIIH